MSSTEDVKPMDVAEESKAPAADAAPSSNDASNDHSKPDSDKDDDSKEPEQKKASKPKKPRAAELDLEANAGSGITDRVKGEKRQRKQTDFLQIGAGSAAEHKEPTFEEGPGTPLGDIPNVQKRMNTLTVKDNVLKRLYRIVYPGIPPKEASLKTHLRKFSGFAKPLTDKEKKTITEKLDITLAELRDLSDLLDTDRKNTKGEYIESIIAFLEHPKASGNEYRMKRKGGGGSKKSGGSAKKAKTESGSSRGPSAYIIFSSEMRAKIKEENPDASFGELGKLIGEKWNALSDEKKQKYKDKAAQGGGGSTGKRKSDDAKAPKAKKPKAAKADDSDDEPVAAAGAPWSNDKAAEQIKQIVGSAKDAATLTFKMIKTELLKTFGEDTITSHKEWIKEKAAAEIQAKSA